MGESGGANNDDSWVRVTVTRTSPPFPRRFLLGCSCWILLEFCCSLKLFLFLLFQDSGRHSQFICMYLLYVFTITLIDSCITKTL